MNVKINFLYESIRDTQLSIRALDMKAGIISVLLFIPLYKLSHFSKIVLKLTKNSDLVITMFSINCLMWIFSIFFVFMSIAAISDPAEKIRGERPSGSFYGAYLFRLGWPQYLFNYHCESAKTLSEEISAIPSDEDGVIMELSYERAKLIYIRSIKSKRMFLCTIFALFWLIDTVILYGVYGGKI